MSYNNPSMADEIALFNRCRLKGMPKDEAIDKRMAALYHVARSNAWTATETQLVINSVLTAAAVAYAERA